jgi:perosamine synthetase
MKKIRLFCPDLGRMELDGVKKVFKKKWIGQGEEVIKLENEFKKFINCKYALATNSGSAALQLAIAAFNFKKKKKILVNNLTFVSSANAILLNNLEPVLVDSDPNTLGFSLEDAKKKVDKNTVALLVVHYGGHPAEMEKITKFAKSKKLKVIEDCAHCLGGVYKGHKLGNWGDAGCFSFEEKKIITSGDGGMITTNDKKLLKKIKAMRWCGIEKDTWSRDKKIFKSNKVNYSWYYEVSNLGYKYNLNDLSAVIARNQLKRINSLNLVRKKLIDLYVKNLKKIGIKTLLPYRTKDSSYWLMGIRHKQREKLMEYLNKKNISTGVHYLPVGRHPLFKKFNKKVGYSNKIWREILTLPLHTNMSKKDVIYIINQIKNFEILKNT